MRGAVLLIVAALTPLAGCNQFQLAGHNLCNEPVQYLDEFKLSHQLRAEAKKVWAEVCRQNGQPFSPDFADGFVDGYVDYLERGGTAAPLAVPPLKYRRSKYMTPEGHALVRDYLAGFKYGADVAVNTGRRDLLTVPVVMPSVPKEVPLNINTEPPAVEGEPLPLPRTAEGK